ncbi:MAG: hypothetical protein U5L01_06135 [Rheinheimera sp.]|nr:hypothetical protein [Rheinheimera sp.]
MLSVRYQNEKWRRRAAFTTPEILQADLLTLRLDVAAWGCQIGDLFWLDAPPTAQLKASAEQAEAIAGGFRQAGQFNCACGKASGLQIRQIGLD